VQEDNQIHDSHNMLHQFSNALSNEPFDVLFLLLKALMVQKHHQKILLMNLDIALLIYQK
jgi:hypothetical protein